MTETALRRAAIALFALTVSLQAGGLAIGAAIGSQPSLTQPHRLDVGLEVTLSVLTALTLVLTWARPRNSVGWLLGAATFFGVLCNFGQAYGTHALAVEDSPLPLGRAVLSFSAPLWLWLLVIPATLLLGRYPTGELSDTWARRVERIVLVALGTLWLGYAASPESVTDSVRGELPPILLPGPVVATLLVGSMLTLVTCLLVIVGMTIRRLLRSSWPERPQLAMLLPATTLSVALVILAPWPWVGTVAFGSLAGAIVVGVLRYQLLGIEVVVRRTLLYGALTGGVAVVFLAGASGLATILPNGPAPQVLAASVVALGLLPARDRLQKVVDHLVYGDRADPWRALSRLGRDAVGGNDLAQVVAAVAGSLRVPGAEVRGIDGTTAAWGEIDEHARVVPLTVGDVHVGELRVSPRRGERALGAADDRLLDALAPLVALVLRSTSLTAALQVERERVVHATEAERARLRRDLHDGLGPSLTGIGLGLEAVDTPELSERSRALVTRMRAEVSGGLEEVRRIIDDLRPGALESGDLLSLLRARARHLSTTTPLRVDVVGPELMELPPDVEAAALRITEEALTNVVRHARATSCVVTLSLEDALRIEVQDDGIGYSGPRPGGVGLASMRSRATALGGRLDVVADNGTRLVAELPLGVPA